MHRGSAICSGIRMQPWEAGNPGTAEKGGQAYNLNAVAEIADPAGVAHVEHLGQPRVGCRGPALHFPRDSDFPDGDKRS